jgi:hypothetical protein
MSVTGFTPKEVVRRLRQDCAFCRLGLAQGTPEKYPGTKVCVRLLDLEALLGLLSDRFPKDDECLTGGEE